MAEDPKYYNFSVDRNELPRDVYVFGKGYVGGKAKGIIYAMKAYQDKVIDSKYAKYVHFPRSYILATEYFDSFIKKNFLKDVVTDKCRQILSVKEMNQKFLESELPEGLISALYEILEKEVGPIIVRSSSLLEDSLEYTFAGIYDSIFIPNTGTLEHRIKNLEETIKKVYSSTFGNDAKEYRKQHKISWHREKMSIIIENVIGREQKEDYYYPLFAGVAFSRNYYPWSKRVMIEDGVGRLVLGFGTRAVGRNYARVFSLSNPSLRPEGSVLNEVVRYSQTLVDTMNLSTGEFKSVPLDDIKLTSSNIYLACSSLKENQYLVPTSKHIGKSERLLPTFDRFLKTDKYYPFVQVLKDVLLNLENLFGIPIDIEFAVDFNEDQEGEFYLLQARPIVNRPEHRRITIPKLSVSDILLKSNSVIGNGYREKIKNIVYVPLENYNIKNSYAIAREIGKINEILYHEQYILIGPGRWGTSSPELGIPVNYSEISNASVIIELSAKGTNPELSYGTHFFGDITATNTLYIPVFPEKGDMINFEFFDKEPNKFQSDLIKLITDKDGFNVYASAEDGIGIICKNRNRLDKRVME